MGPGAGMVAGVVFQFDRKAPAKGVGEDWLVAADSRGLPGRPADGRRYGLKTAANHGEPHQFLNVCQFHRRKAEDSLAVRPVLDLPILARSDSRDIRLVR